MSIQPMLPSDFLALVVLLGVLLVICIFVPVKLVAKWRRLQHARTHLTCRICGFRFLRRDAEGICPHCQSRN
ncbi:MAG: hypothetical protein IKY91_07905 [Akkermansia sp.]|nr:hypothetical protein [Akkermansia sp.]